MAEIIKLKKTIYSNSINNIINNRFTQLVPQSTEIIAKPNLDINGFFEQYDLLFFEIPPSGSDNSHLGLATKSLDYLGVSLNDLTTEISNLREENIELKNQILLSSQINIGTQK
jgi:hypothetical protein